MREILVTTLILGVLASHAMAAIQKGGDFRFHDAEGRCWLCDSEFHCQLCSTQNLPWARVLPPDWPVTCLAPTAADCAANPGFRFPHPDLSRYFQCGADGSAPTVATQCPCDTLFDLTLQDCVRTDLVETFFCNPIDNFLPEPCLTTTTAEIPTAPDVTTTVSEDITTTTTTDLDSTTVGGGQDEDGPTTTTPPGDTTTSSSCVCILWWPCSCNPCWTMPCHSCGGCMPGMGGMGMGMGGMGMGGMGMGMGGMGMGGMGMMG